MRRRELLSVLAGAAIWPIRVRAQEPAMPVIGFLHQGSADQNVERIATFRQGLTQAGFVENKNVAIEFRWAEGKFDRLPALAAELVQRQVAVFATPFSTDAALAAKAATTTIPIVFLTSADPVQVGLVPSLNRPGGNVTGVTTLNNELAPKRLELLRDLVPNATRYFALINPTSALAEKFTRDIEAAATRLAIHVEMVRASNETELEAAFARIPPQSLLVSSTDAFFFVQRERIASLAIRHGVPSAFDAPAYTRAGGLLSYSGEDNNLLLLTTSYVGRILRGERPADLPVAQPDKFVLTINLKTARALGVHVPPTLLARADEVIE
jgi:putative tryptophan/tyrosine transport system substrate-binding protein